MELKADDLITLIKALDEYILPGASGPRQQQRQQRRYPEDTGHAVALHNALLRELQDKHGDAIDKEWFHHNFL